jgi:hypothetical protein
LGIFVTSFAHSQPRLVSLDSSTVAPLTSTFVSGYVNLKAAGMRMIDEQRGKPGIWRCILTDVQFWIPVVVLAMGIGLLVFVHGS